MQHCSSPCSCLLTCLLADTGVAASTSGKRRKGTSAGGSDRTLRHPQPQPQPHALLLPWSSPFLPEPHHVVYPGHMQARWLAEGSRRRPTAHPASRSSRPASRPPLDSCSQGVQTQTSTSPPTSKSDGVARRRVAPPSTVQSAPTVATGRRLQAQSAQSLSSKLKIPLRTQLPRGAKNATVKSAGTPTDRKEREARETRPTVPSHRVVTRKATKSKTLPSITKLPQRRPSPVPPKDAKTPKRTASRKSGKSGKPSASAHRLLPKTPVSAPQRSSTRSTKPARKRRRRNSKTSLLPSYSRTAQSRTSLFHSRSRVTLPPSRTSRTTLLPSRSRKTRSRASLQPFQSRKSISKAALQPRRSRKSTSKASLLPSRCRKSPSRLSVPNSRTSLQPFRTRKSPSRASAVPSRTRKSSSGASVLPARNRKFVSRISHPSEHTTAFRAESIQGEGRRRCPPPGPRRAKASDKTEPVRAEDRGRYRAASKMKNPLGVNAATLQPAGRRSDRTIRPTTDRPTTRRALPGGVNGGQPRPSVAAPPPAASRGPSAAMLQLQVAQHLLRPECIRQMSDRCLAQVAQLMPSRKPSPMKRDKVATPTAAPEQARTKPVSTAKWYGSTASKRRQGLPMPEAKTPSSTRTFGPEQGHATTAAHRPREKDAVHRDRGNPAAPPDRALRLRLHAQRGHGKDADDDKPVRRRRAAAPPARPRRAIATPVRDTAKASAGTNKRVIALAAKDSRLVRRHGGVPCEQGVRSGGVKKVESGTRSRAGLRHGGKK